jgi:hypothetical protein
MMRTIDTIIDRVRVREVAGIFRSQEQADAAVAALLSSGFDRADVDIATREDARQRLGIDVPPEELPEVPGVPRRPVIGREDAILVSGIVVGIAAFAGAALGAAGVIADGGGAAAAIVTALAGAVLFAGIAAWILELIRRRNASKLDLSPAAELILLVRARSPEREDKAQQMLREYGAEAVRVHEIEIEKRLEDVPLSSLRVDPWLGDERLGQP